jgi:hypothetical protein
MLYLALVFAAFVALTLSLAAVSAIESSHRTSRAA